MRLEQTVRGTARVFTWHCQELIAAEKPEIFSVEDLKQKEAVSESSSSCDTATGKTLSLLIILLPITESFNGPLITRGLLVFEHACVRWHGGQDTCCQSIALDLGYRATGRAARRLSVSIVSSTRPRAGQATLPQVRPRADRFLHPTDHEQIMEEIFTVSLFCYFLSILYLYLYAVQTILYVSMVGRDTRPWPHHSIIVDWAVTSCHGQCHLGNDIMSRSTLSRHHCHRHDLGA
jgi:hypothetical protein